MPGDVGNGMVRDERVHDLAGIRMNNVNAMAARLVTAGTDVLAVEAEAEAAHGVVEAAYCAQADPVGGVPDAHDGVRATDGTVGAARVERQALGGGRVRLDDVHLLHARVVKQHHLAIIRGQQQHVACVREGQVVDEGRRRVRRPDVVRDG